MIAEKDRLEEFADALRDKLNYFDQLEKVAGNFRRSYISAKATRNGSEVATANRFTNVEAIGRLSRVCGVEPAVRDEWELWDQFKQLQTRAMSTVREYCLKRSQATKNAQDAKRAKELER